MSRIPWVLSLWHWLNRSAIVTHVREACKLRRIYGEFAPESLILINSGTTMYVDSSEKRGRAVLCCGATGQHMLKTIWGNMVRQLRPTLVLDVGLNYGEFLLNELYLNNAKIIGIEANPLLMPHLIRSIATHPNSDQIQLLHAIADAETAPSGEFYVNAKWSGSSSALPVSENADYKVCNVPVIAIDDLVSDRTLEQDRLVYKIDVEGFEPRVLAGMTKLLTRCPQWLGLIEFNGAYLEKLCVTPESLLEKMLVYGKIYAIDHDGTNKKIDSANWRVHFPNISLNQLNIDLVLISHKAVVQEDFLNKWSISN